MSASTCKQPETAAQRYGLPHLGLWLINYRSPQMCKQQLWHHYHNLERGITPGGAPARALLWPSIASLAGRTQAAESSQACPIGFFNLVLWQWDKPPCNGQACLEMPAGVLKTHHLFLRAAKIQPEPGQGHSSCPLHRQHGQQPSPPARRGSRGWGYSPHSPFRDRKGAA